MKKYQIPKININEFKRASILAASENVNVASAKEWLGSEKGIGSANTTLAALTN